MRITTTLAFLVLVTILAGCQNNKQNPRDLKTQLDSVSYLIGTDFGVN